MKQATVNVSRLTIDPQDRLPIHEQVKRQVLDRIRSGAWQPGQRLPADEMLARELGIHYHTVRSALAELAKQGHLTRQQGRGTFVVDRQLRTHYGIFFGCDVAQLSSSQFFTLFAKHAQDYFHEHHSEAKLYVVQRWLRERHGSRDEDLARDIEHRALRACLVIGGAQFVAADTFDLLLRQRVPFVLSTTFPTDFPSSGFDFDGLVEQGIGYLVARGYRRIAIVYGRHPEAPVPPENEFFYQGYQRALARFGLEWRREWLKDEREPGPAAGYLAMKELWALGERRPDAVLSCDDVMTQGIIHAWWELGIRPPHDLGFITHANKELPLLYPAPLTRLECDVKELVNAAGQMLLTLAESKPLAQRKVFIAARLVAGKSCGEQ